MEQGSEGVIGEAVVRVSLVVIEKGLAGSGGEDGGEGNCNLLRIVGYDVGEPCPGCSKVEGGGKGSQHWESQELISSGRSVVLRSLL